jgi:transcriptional/translational regulatory protein YebC/TACO1
VHSNWRQKESRPVVANVTELASVTVPLQEEQSLAVNKLLDALEDHDDV